MSNFFIVNDNFHELQWKGRSLRMTKEKPELEKIPLTMLILSGKKFPFLEQSQF